MKKKIKQILSALLVAVMLVGIAPVSGSLLKANATVGLKTNIKFVNSNQDAISNKGCSSYFVLNEDGTFYLLENAYEGFLECIGSYRISNNKLFLDVSKYKNLLGSNESKKDQYSFDIIDNYSVRINNNISMTKKNDVFKCLEKIEKPDYNEVINQYVELKNNNFYRGKDFGSIDNYIKKYVSRLLVIHKAIYGDLSNDIWYSLYDIDKNGVNELIISDKNDGSGNIYDIFTYANGKIYSLHNEISGSYSSEYSSWGERTQISLYKNGVIGIYGSGGAYAHGMSFYRIGTDGYSMICHFDVEILYDKYYISDPFSDSSSKQEVSEEFFEKGCEWYSSGYYPADDPDISLEWRSIDDYVASESIPDGMRVAINNSNLSFVKNENILIAVSEFKDNKESYIDKLSVKVSDSDIVKVSGIYDYSNLPSIFKKTESYKNCRFISLKAQSVGAAVVQLTNSRTGQIREIPITVAEDNYLGCRASDVKTHTFKGVLGNWVVEKDYYNAQSGGIWVADFDYKEVSGGWNYSMNLYNENYSCGVLEVYNADGTLRQIEIIDKFESLTKGIFKCAEAGWILLDNAYQGDSLSFRSSTTAKETRIKDIFVPQGGRIKVTDDVSVSVNCAVTNAFDMLFTAWSLADDIGGVIKGIKKISSENVKALTKAAMAKLLVQEEYLKFGEKFQEKFCEKCATEMSLNTINRYASLLFLDVDVLLDNLEVSLNDILKMAWGSGVSVAEGLFENCAGPYGMILKATFLIQDAGDLINESKDIIKRKTGNIVFGCTTPLAGHTDMILKGENVTVNTNGNTDSSVILETYRIQSGSKYVNLIKNLTGIENPEYQLYEIALHSSGGKKIQPSGNVTVYIECPYSFATVYKQDENGNWILIDSHKENGMIVFDVDHFCKFLVINDEKLDESDSIDFSKLSVGDEISFGSYPQTEVTDATTLKNLNSLSINWSSYDYSYGKSITDSAQATTSDYMQYADIVYGGEKYRAVKMSQLRPSINYYPSSTTYSEQDDNGYDDLNKVYWFKYEPLKWIVLDSTSGLVMCKNVIDSQEFNKKIFDDKYGDSNHNHFANNYEQSSIRNWLNKDFYNIAFSSTDKTRIEEKTLSNVAYDKAQFNSGDTTDKITLLSFAEYQKIKNDYRLWQAGCSNYALCQGVSSNSGNTVADWMLRTAGTWSDVICSVSYSGAFSTSSTETYNSSMGIRPVVYLKTKNSESKPKVQGVSVGSDIKINYKKSETINYSVTADKGAKYSVSFTSSNPKVVTVDENGKVYAAKRGSATITCTVTDSNGNTVQDTCKVTVKYSFGQWLIKILLFGWIWY